MKKYKLWVNTRKGQIIVEVVANSAMAAMEAAKAQGGPGAYCGILSTSNV